MRRGRGELIRLFALAAALLGAAPVLAAPDLVGRLDLSREGLGGLSGIEVTPDGTGITLVGDRGLLLRGHLSRDPGALTGIELTSEPMTGVLGGPLLGPFANAEGVALLPGGGMAISYELLHRILVHRADGTTVYIAPPPDAPLSLNGGIEALAAAPDGSLWAVPEVPGAEVPVYRYAAGRWTRPFALPRSRGLNPAGADIGPDGRLYILERGQRAGGFVARVRRVALDGTGAETMLETAPGAHDNLEGLAVWRDGTGRIRLTLVADDNYDPALRGEVVEYRLDAAASSS